MTRLIAATAPLSSMLQLNSGRQNTAQQGTQIKDVLSQVVVSLWFGCITVFFSQTALRWPPGRLSRSGFNQRSIDNTDELNTNARHRPKSPLWTPVRQDVMTPSASKLWTTLKSERTRVGRIWTELKTSASMTMRPNGCLVPRASTRVECRAAFFGGSVL